MALSESIDQEIKQAMLNKEQRKLIALRAVKSALLLARTEKGAEDTLAEADEIKILQKLVKQRKESAAIYQDQGRNDLADSELAEIAFIESYLPKQMSTDEIELKVKEAIALVGATSIQDMGKVMGAASKAMAGQADNRIVSEVVKRLLS